VSFFRSRWVKPPDRLEELDTAELAPGFRASGVACGIKPRGLDLGLVVCDEPKVASAAVFTANAAAAAPVRVCRERAQRHSLRALVANSGNANAATGERGVADAIRMQEAAAASCDLPFPQVGVASTGVIGEPLPIAEVERGISEAAASLRGDGGASFAEAIVTTDRAPKLCSVRCDGISLSVQAKGAGMIQPGFATLLAFVQTDAVVRSPGETLRRAADGSFGRITVDGQLSTNDSVFMQASGASGRELPDGLLEAALMQLALDVAADGEGATRVARVSVSEARDDGEAERVARAIANSPLVQTALFGRDPNWGRAVQAAGMALAGDQVELGGGDVDASDLASDESEVELALRLGRGRGAATVFCSDLTYDYVRINAEYTT
jgi:glutamate N-acetyltransferase / amino-acid N-acetyltransferase